MIAPLSRARVAGGLAALVAQEPPRFTAADRLEGVATEASAALIARLDSTPAALAEFLAQLGETAMAVDKTDGMRVTLASGRCVHMRPSGNAPEFRLYAEAETAPAASDLLQRGLELLHAHRLTKFNQPWTNGQLARRPLMACRQTGAGSRNWTTHSMPD